MNPFQTHDASIVFANGGGGVSNPPLFFKAGQACFKAYEYPFQTNDASVVFANGGGGGGCAPPNPPAVFLVRASLLQST